jgi:hypothetical protein
VSRLSAKTRAALGALVAAVLSTVAAAVPATVAGAAATAAPAGRLSGLVENAHGTALGHATVRLVSPQGTTAASGKADGAGRYALG